MKQLVSHRSFFPVLIRMPCGSLLRSIPAVRRSFRQIARHYIFLPIRYSHIHRQRRRHQGGKLLWQQHWTADMARRARMVPVKRFQPHAVRNRQAAARGQKAPLGALPAGPGSQNAEKRCKPHSSHTCQAVPPFPHRRRAPPRGGHVAWLSQCGPSQARYPRLSPGKHRGPNSPGRARLCHRPHPAPSNRAESLPHPE